MYKLQHLRISCNYFQYFGTCNYFQKKRERSSIAVGVFIKINMVANSIAHEEFQIKLIKKTKLFTITDIYILFFQLQGKSRGLKIIFKLYLYNFQSGLLTTTFQYLHFSFRLKDQSRGLRIIVICAFVFSVIITVALILSIYLGPPQVSLLSWGPPWSRG